MKATTLFLFVLLFAVLIGNAQTLPIDFETTITTANFVDFDGGTGTVIPNPQSNGINTSNMVAQIVRNGGQPWAGSKIDLSNNLDFTTLNSLSMKIFTTAPVGTVVKFKLEDANNTGNSIERDVQTTVSNEWEALTWDFTGTAPDFNSIVFMFDFGNIGDGSQNSTFLFDDIEQLFGGTQIDLPVDFEGSTVNYSLTDFGGNSSSLVTDPTDAGNTVVQVVKTNEAATWAGTTIGTSAGFASNIPLTLEDSKMTVRVWSPEAGTPIRLKVEDSNDPTHTCETETNTTVSGDWELLEFDFANQAPGTEFLSVGLDMGWTYNMASIFFNFGTDGATAGEKTYYFDNVKFGDLALGVDNITQFALEGLNVLSNPTDYEWTIVSENTNIVLVELFDLQGKPIFILDIDNGNPNGPGSHIAKIDASNFATGIYISKITTNLGTKMIKLVKK